MDNIIATVLVGFATSRPIVPDEQFTAVTVMADNEIEATLIAAQMTMCRLDCVMPTSTEIVSLTF